LLKGGAKVGKLPLSLLPKVKQQAIKKKFYSSIGSDAMLLPHMQDTYRNIINEDMQAEAAKIELPTLLIYGDKDKSTPPTDGLLFQKAVNHSDLKIISGAGHFLHQEESGRVSDLIKQFLKTESDV
jgi:pimeloyl-ACP methyl ester carboxylesterase